MAKTRTGRLLHGVLHVTILEVENKLYHGNDCCNCFSKLFDKAFPNGKSSSGIYTTIELGNATVGRTRVINNDPSHHHHHHLQWNESLKVYTAHIASNVVFHIKEEDPIGAKLIGRAYFPIEELLGSNGQILDTWLQIFKKKHNNKPLKGRPRIHVQIQFIDVTYDNNWSQGIKSSEFQGLTDTYFSQRSGCRVTLYQDAHVPATFSPKIVVAGRNNYQPRQCWEDVFDAISKAEHLIYIAGWSVYTKITLIREFNGRKPLGSDLTLGELLKMKANEGVTVLMLIWDDRTSIKWLKNDGVMTTHDEDTESYFHGTGVHCILCPRNPDNGESLVQGIEVATMFTHHQKIVIVDSEIGGAGSSERKRRISSFIGGIDLCDGRYDTPVHSVFRTLGTVHHDDFRQPNFKGASVAKGGPREPWHDIHCRLEGPVARDVLANFEQRWKKQGKKDVIPVELGEFADTFIPVSQEKFAEDEEEEEEGWNVQVFRSIDGGAAFGLPNTKEEASRCGLLIGKDHVIDRSIQNAYIDAIRRAKNFIYIENQYFIGSSFSWNSQDNHLHDVDEVGALNLIPKELSLKIVSKIEAEERFSVYVVIPMWPEGVPESNSVQSILNWQRLTMDMMYTDVALALQAKGINDADPKEYLSFFCLGNREMKKSDGEYVASKRPTQESDYSRAQQARRFMIYVHAKMMIVDDEYIIIGSANINQRSMDGARDTEIAMGGYQPKHIAKENEPARGQIHGFRMSLWYEHLGFLDPSFLAPESLQCIRQINNVSQRYWELYCSETLDDDIDMHGHLLSYPIRVTERGKVTTHPGLEFFPDTKARILGSKTELPSILTS